MLWLKNFMEICYQVNILWLKKISHIIMHQQNLNTPAICWLSVNWLLNASQNMSASWSFGKSSLFLTCSARIKYFLKHVNFLGVLDFNTSKTYLVIWPREVNIRFFCCESIEKAKSFQSLFAAELCCGNTTFVISTYC